MAGWPHRGAGGERGHPQLGREQPGLSTPGTEPPCCGWSGLAAGDRCPLRPLHGSASPGRSLACLCSARPRRAFVASAVPVSLQKLLHRPWTRPVLPEPSTGLPGHGRCLGALCVPLVSALGAVSRDPRGRFLAKANAGAVTGELGVSPLWDASSGRARMPGPAGALRSAAGHCTRARQIWPRPLHHLHGRPCFPCRVRRSEKL